MDIDEALGIEELRGRFLKHSRQAYQLLPPLDRPRILDIGCGRGLQTLELARLSDGHLVGIDVDADALAKLQQRINEAELGNRIQALHVSLFDNTFDDASFDLLWEEGVLHLLDTSRSLAECHRLLKAGGHLVMHETIRWFDGVRAALQRHGLEVVDQHMLPRHFWWTDYGAPLERRIQAFRQAHGDGAQAPELTEHEQAAAAIKADPDQTDCGIYLVRKGG